jgi:hypothetical protein
VETVAILKMATARRTGPTDSSTRVNTVSIVASPIAVCATRSSSSLRGFQTAIFCGLQSSQATTASGTTR